MEEQAVRLLLEQKKHVVFVESCTGGMLASTLIGVSGASGVLEQSFITYSNDAKHKLVDVKKSTLEKYGAVSRETAMEMALGGVKRAGADVGVSVTGVAGPGTEEEKPVGLVYIGISHEGQCKAEEYHFHGTRQEIREQAVAEALKLLIHELSMN